MNWKPDIPFISILGCKPKKLVLLAPCEVEWLAERQFHWSHTPGHRPYWALEGRTDNVDWLVGAFYEAALREAVMEGLSEKQGHVEVVHNHGEPGVHAAIQTFHAISGRRMCYPREYKSSFHFWHFQAGFMAKGPWEKKS